ncbi:MAG: DUF58 domain-containing protein [bacterium]
MISEEIRRKIKKIKIYTKKLIQTGLSGDYLSAFKGSGLEFDKIRDYQIGDDVRFIDWNSSARMNKIMVKQFVEERERTIILVIDVSGSLVFSSKKDLKKDMVATIASILAFVSSENKDKVGALFFSDKIEKWIEPARGELQVGKILENIFSINPKGSKTNINECLKFLINLKKRNSIVFFLSDWIDDIENYFKILKVAACEYDFVGVRILDERERSFPDVGLIEVKDLESGDIFAIDTRRKNQDKTLNTLMDIRLLEQKGLFDKYKIDLLDLTVGHDFIQPMVNFFRSRIRRQI